MASYFHLAQIMLARGSIIEPGNFGRIIRQRGVAHNLYRREMVYEAVRQQHFPSRPSRLDCLFCFPTHEEAELCRAHINGYADSVLYKVESAEDDPHLADMNNGLLNAALETFDANAIAYYWRGWQRSPDPKAVILREVLLRSPVMVVQRL